MNSLLALTFVAAAILVGAIAYSFGSLRNGVGSQEQEKEKLRQEIALLNLNSYTPATEPIPVTQAPEPTQSEIERNEDEVAAMKAEIAALRAEQELAMTQAEEVEITPEPIVPEIDPDTEERLQRRARQVNNAMLMAFVDQYYPEDGFVSIKVQNSNNVIEGVKLAIRRNTGIVGHLEVTTVEGNEAIADVIGTTFLGGTIDIQPGDELILPPL